jgi:hypothetical protein
MIGFTKRSLEKIAHEITEYKDIPEDIKNEEESYADDLPENSTWREKAVLCIKKGGGMTRKRRVRRRRQRFFERNGIGAVDFFLDARNNERGRRDD